MDDAEATTKTFESFGYEWNRFDAINDEDEAFWHRYFADVDLDLDALKNTRALDPGCGNARSSNFPPRHLRLPRPLLRVLAAPLAALLYVTLVLPGHVFKGLPLQTYRGRPLRSLWLDTFDRLSAPLEHRYVWSELEPWFTETHLEVQAVREEAGLYIVARRPATEK